MARDMAEPSIDIAESLARLSAATIFELRGEWRRLHRASPPMRLSRDLLMRGITYKLQERPLGGLSKSIMRKLERLNLDSEAVSSRPEIECRGKGAPVVIPARFTEDVRADFRAQNRLDFRRIVRIGVVMGWPSQSRPLKGSPRDLRGFGWCERQVRRREPTEPEYVNPCHREVPKP